MKKKIATFVLTVVGSVLLIALLVSNFGNQYDEANVNREVSIEWSTVNLRENHSTWSDIITEINYGETVTLTGYSYEYFGGDGQATESWTEVELPNGKTGWIVTTSINWNPNTGSLI